MLGMMMNGWLHKLKYPGLIKNTALLKPIYIYIYIYTYTYLATKQRWFTYKHV